MGRGRGEEEKRRGACKEESKKTGGQNETGEGETGKQQWEERKRGEQSKAKEDVYVQLYLFSYVYLRAQKEAKELLLTVQTCWWA